MVWVFNFKRSVLWKVFLGYGEAFFFQVQGLRRFLALPRPDTEVSDPETFIHDAAALEAVRVRSLRVLLRAESLCRARER